MVSKEFIFLMALFLAMGTAIILITPYGEFGDEQTHFAYASYIRTNFNLPPMSFDVSKIPVQQAFQPPLYYMVGALFLLNDMQQSTAVLVLRFFSILLAALSLLFVWKTSSLIFNDRYMWMLPTSIAAFNPQFLYVNCGVTSISMMTFTGSLTIYLMVRILSTQTNLTRSAAALGLCFGATMLSRTITVFLFPVCLATLYVASRDNRAGQTGWLRYVFLFLICSFAVAGWWYIRNWILYGDPFALRAYQATVGSGWIRKDPFDWFYVLKIFAWLHAYFWAYFGRQQYHAEVYDYAVYLLLQGLAAIGIWEIFKTRKKDGDFESPVFNKRGFILLLGTAFMAVLQIVALQWRIASPQGRYLYTAIAALAIPMGAGLIKIVPHKRRIAMTVSFVAFMFSMCLYLLLRYWLPHYI